MSKARVAPLNSINISWLELLVTILWLKLVERVTGALQREMKDVAFWCDSMNGIWWIRNQGRKLKPFVGNCVGLIHSQADPNQWRYIPTKMNTADLLTRGSTVHDLAKNTTWCNGPSFLNAKWKKDHWMSSMHQMMQNQNQKKQLHQKEYSFPDNQLTEWQTQIDLIWFENWPE